VNRRILFRDRLFRSKQASIMKAARKDSAVHVSLSSDSIFKQPGDLAVPTPRQAGKSSLTRSKHRASDQPRKPLSL
jgi:hypothetical protein